MQSPILKATDLGQIVREARKLQGLSQEELAGITGTGRRFIIDLEQGKQTAQIGKILLVFAALGVGLIASSKWQK